MRDVQGLIDEWERGDDEPPADVNFDSLAQQAAAKVKPQPELDAVDDSMGAPPLESYTIDPSPKVSMAESTRVAPASFSAAPDASEIGDAVSAPKIAPIKPVSAISPLSDRGSRSAAAAPAPSPDAPADPSKMDWKQLGDALNIAELARASSQNYENLFANVGAQSGYKPNAHAGEVGLRLARQPIDLAKERQGMESQAMTAEAHRAAMEDRRKAAGVKEAMDNPNSLQSQKAREAWKAFGLPMPPGFDSWSANDVQRYSTGAAGARTVAEKNADDAAKAAAKAKADAERAAAGKADLEASRKNYAAELKKLGIDPSTASQKDIDRAISLGHSKATEAMAASNNALARSAESRKAGDYNALQNDIPFAGTSLKYTGAGTPRAEDVDKVQSTAGLYGAAIRGMDDLEGAMSRFAQHPGAETRDEVIAKTQAVSGHLNTALGQGAMSKDEKAEMAKALGVDLTTPGGIQAFVDKLTGDDKAAAAAMTRRIKAVRDSTRASALGKIEPYRFAPAGKLGGNKASGKVKVSNGKESFMVDPSDVAEAEADGFKVVR